MTDRRGAPAGERGEGSDHAARVLAARQGGPDARDPRASARAGAERRARRAGALRSRRPARNAARARGGVGDAVSPDVHLGHDRRAERVVHVQGGFLVSIAREAAYQADLHRATSCTSRPTWAGSWGRGRSSEPARSARQSCSPRRARLAGAGPPVADGRSGGGHVARTVADARPRTRPARRPGADLSSLRTFVTTGEPWNPEPYRWLFEDVGRSRVPVINCSGGTEVGACFLSPTVVGPIKACSLGGPALGMAMDVVDGDGGRWSAPGRSASWSAGGRSRG